MNGNGGLTPRQRATLRHLFDDDQIIRDAFKRWACSSDASIYRLVPAAIVRPRDAAQVRQLIEMAPQLDMPLTFRGAGTSLSGQAIGTGILVELASADWATWEILDDGRRVAFGPGVKAGFLNAKLKPFGRKIGPDPASIRVVTMGGVLANNASGMCCGVDQNSYRTLESMTVVLADGRRIDSSLPGASEAFRRDHAALADGLLDIRRRILEDPALSERISRKFQIKNTSGYGMNSFLDFEDPLDILIHLMIGSEGTLGFIERAVLRTLPDRPFKTTGLFLFDEIEHAARAVAGLERAGAAAVELLDSASLKVARGQGVLVGFDGEIEADYGGLLVELEAQDGDALGRSKALAEAHLKEFSLLGPVRFEDDEEQRQKLWQVRQHLFPAVSSVRARGTGVVIEDICVPVEKIPEVVRALHAAFRKHGFDNHVIFGHAKSGNLHFVLHPDADDAESLKRYGAFMEELAFDLVSQFDGSLKAEHGTGRNMAPFLSREWGEPIAGLMAEVKRLLDPRGILNPGVIINPDPRCHLKHLKRIPLIDPLVDGCMECGFCEPSCPSFGFTLSPRQRIVALRAHAQGGGGPAWQKAFRFQGVDSCAADGLCAQACPFDINTGDLMKQWRHRSRGRVSRCIAGIIARDLSWVLRMTRLGLNWLAWMRRTRWGRAWIDRMTSIKVFGPFHIGRGAVLPRAQSRIHLPEHPKGEQPVVYFPTCINVTMGTFPGERQPLPLPEAVIGCLTRLGFAPFTPKPLRRCCCGTPFFSKGFLEAGLITAQRTLEALWTASQQGRIPVVTDVSPCAAELKHYAKRFPDDPRAQKLKVLELAEFLAPHLDRIRGEGRGTVVLHPNCTMVRQGAEPAVRDLLAQLGRRVIVPETWGCCGYAGDRGLLVPKLTKHATQREALEVRKILDDDPNAALVSGCRTCEMGMSQSVGRPYQSYVFELYRALCSDEGDAVRRSR